MPGDSAVAGGDKNPTLHLHVVSLGTCSHVAEWSGILPAIRITSKRCRLRTNQFVIQAIAANLVWDQNPGTRNAFGHLHCAKLF